MEPHNPSERNETLRGVGEDEEQEEEVEQGRVPRTRKCPDGMSAEELRVHSLTHIPYHPACKCCVAGRKIDHPHPLRDSGHLRRDAEIGATEGSSRCAGYFFPRDKPGDGGNDRGDMRQ